MAAPPDLRARFAAAMQRLVPHRPARLGLAVSGGGDSVALMALAADWDAVPLAVATVDHGLRTGSAQEARMVAEQADRFGLPHTTLHWQRRDGRGNLQDAARRARRALLADWARHERLDGVLLGHTADDQAETVLMRLARGSGVDGLAAMPEVSDSAGTRWLRPLLAMSRADLRHLLQDNGLIWADDPSNDDTAFTRVKARQMADRLADLGLTRARLVDTAQRMAEARAVLDGVADTAEQTLRRMDHGDVVFDAPGLDALPEDTRNRLVARALCDVASAPYRPRMKALRIALTARRATLHGCLITRDAYNIRITRELRAVQDLQVPLGQIWDQRWHIRPPAEAPGFAQLHIAALGPAGLAACPDRTLWRLPRLSLLASPAVWHGTQLVAAPFAGFAPTWEARLRQTATPAPPGRYSH